MLLSAHETGSFYLHVKRKLPFITNRKVDKLMSDRQATF